MEETAVAIRPEAKSGVLYAVTAETIKSKAADLLALKVNGIDDEAGMIAVKEGLKLAVKWRTSVEATRKELKADILAAGRKVDSDAEEIQSLISPIEKHLREQKESVEREQARLKKIEEDRLFELRSQRLAEVEGTMDPLLVRTMSESDFADAIEVRREQLAERRAAAAKAAEIEAERQRQLKEQQEANRLEQERLAAERKAFEAERLAAQAERDRLQKIEDDRRAAERAEQARLQKIEDEKRREEQAALAKERAELQAEKDRLAKIEADRQRALREDAERQERILFEQTQAHIKAEREAEEKARAEANAKRAEELKPVRQKLHDFANRVQSLNLPKVGEEAAAQVQAVLATAAESIRSVAEQLR